MSVDRLRPTSGPKPRRRFRKVRAIAATQNGNLLDNAAIAELLIREVETASEHRRLAFKRAARAAFIWPEEAAILRQKEGRSPNWKESVHGLPDGCTICLSRRPRL